MTTESPPTSRCKCWLPLAGLLVVVAAVYASSIGHGFVPWDDPDLVYENPGLLNPTFGALGRFWTAPYQGLYTPLAYSMWWVVARFTFNPQAFHLLNITLHLATTGLVFSISRRLSFTQWTSLAAAAFFALHPLQVEPVVWVSGMNNLLAGALALLAIRIYLNGSKRSYAIATAIFVLALLAKPTAVTVPLIVAIVDLLILKRAPRTTALRVVPWLVLAGLSIAATHYAQPAERIADTSFGERTKVAVDALGFYAAKTVVPMDLTVDYGRSPRWLMRSGAHGIQVVGLFLIILCLATWKKWPQLSASVTIFIAALLPVLGLTPFDFQRYSTVADRYAYLAMLGPAMLVGLVAMRKSWLPAAGIVIGVLAILTLIQVTTWSTPQRLFERNLQLHPNSLAANYVLGFGSARRNDLESAIRYYGVAVENHPREFQTQFNLANAYLRVAQYDRAIAHYRAALELRDSPPATNNLAVALASSGDLAGAEAVLRALVNAHPDYADAHATLGRVLLKRGKRDESAASFRRALELDPHSDVARGGLDDATTRP